MAEKKQNTGFTVTDRRMFTDEGDLRNDQNSNDLSKNDLNKNDLSKNAVDAAKTPAGPAAVPSPKSPDGAQAASAAPDSAPTAEVPAAPSAAEQQAQADAYRQSASDMDARVKMAGRSAKDFEMTFERFLASLYMTAMLQLGLMHEQGAQPQVDIIGARQTIDTLSLLAEKTKGNLTATEQNFLQNSLYEVRMAYVEVMNALSRPPQPGAATGTGGR